MRELIPAQKQGQVSDRPSLTELPGREQFEAALNVAVQRGAPFTLLIGDVDDLKLINDLYGHPVGDDAIAAVTCSLQEAFGHTAYVFGGDELAVLVPESGPGSVSLSRTAAELAHRWRDRPLLTAPALHVTASVGGCRYPEEGQDARTLYARADERLYAAKRAGGARVALADLPSGERPGPGRLLERQDLLLELMPLLGPGGRAQVRGAPGTGRSAFASLLERAATLAGLRVLRIAYGPPQQLRDDGWRHVSWLDGFPLRSLEELQNPEAQRPLAVIFDLNAVPTSAMMASLAGVLGEAHLVITVGEQLPGTGQQDRPDLTLSPLSAPGVASLLRTQLRLPIGVSLPDGWQAWAFRVTQGLPAQVAALARQLLIEAGRQRISLAGLLGQVAPDAPDQKNQGLLQIHIQLYDRARTKLPPVTELYGRISELERALDLLSQGGLLCLHGPSGRGKTRLAVQVALELQARMAGPVLWLDARAYQSPEAMMAAIATALGVPAGDRVSLLAALLGQDRLLVLDDVRPYGGLSELIEQLCAGSPWLRVLVTAHQPLGVQRERLLFLPPLPHDGTDSPAARLVRAAAPALSPEAAARLAEASGGEALDARLLARAAEFRDVDQVLLEVRGAGQATDPRPELLPASRPLPGLAYSWSRFSAHERQVMARLSAYDGPFDAEAMRHVAQASDLLMSALIQQGHVQAYGAGTYHLPELLGHLAREELDRSPRHRRQVARALLGDMRRRLGPHSLRGAEGRRRFEMHRLTLESAFRALVDGPVTSGLAQVLEEACSFWIAGGRAAVARDLLERARRQGPLGRGLRLTTALSRVHQELGEHDVAERLLRQALRSARPGAARSRAQLTLGRVLHRRSAYQEAAEVFSRVLASPAKTLAVRCQALHQRGRARLYLGQLLEAEADADAALEVAPPDERAWALNTLALIRVQQGQFPEAQTLFTEALALHEAHSEYAGAALNLTGLAWTLMLAGDARGSAQANELLLRRFQESGSFWELTNTLTNLGHARARLGDWPGARAALLDALQRTVQLDAPSLQAEVIGAFADLALREGDTQQAARLFFAACDHPGNTSEFRHFFAHLSSLPPPDTVLTWTQALQELLVEATSHPISG
ncbi:diguanylate cyclase domain-containing protein [Deinococcus altitudinis]|uniref:diguanylate cyclase domain-containing protein n=1 Tax=Deinococcus altitudinis TaxID=468914 RepID=UPI0038913DDA